MTNRVSAVSMTEPAACNAQTPTMSVCAGVEGDESLWVYPAHIM